VGEGRAALGHLVVELVVLTEVLLLVDASQAGIRHLDRTWTSWKAGIPFH